MDIKLIENNLDYDIKVVYKDTTLSTNIDVKNHIQNTREKVVYIADEQTQGRGRIGHDFISPKGGIYMSLFIPKESIPKAQLSIITPLAGVAVAKAIKDILDIQVDIKWINDLIYKDKKVCGILAEAVVKGSSIDGVVIGIGIDYKIDTTRLDSELSSIIGTLIEKDEKLGQKEALIASTINNIYYLVSKLPDKSFMDYYRAHCITLNKEISYYINNVQHIGKATNILDDGRLVVLEEGQARCLDSGEVFNIR